MAALITHPSTPNIKNNYGVDFQEINSGMTCVVQRPWVNPYSRNMHIIKPFIPSSSEIELDNLEKTKELYNLETFLHSLIGETRVKDFISLSAVNKTYYSLSKSDLTWKKQIKHLLCNVNVLSSDKCIFTPEKQFQIAFKYLQSRLKPYCFQFCHNILQSITPIYRFEKVLNSEKLSPAEMPPLELKKRLHDFFFTNQNTELYSADPEDIQKNYLKALKHLESFGTLPSEKVDSFKFNRTVDPKSNLGRCITGFGCIASIIPQVKNRLGQSFNGTSESIDPQKPEGKCLVALDYIREELNCQDKFESIIQESETALNTASILNNDALMSEEPDIVGPDDDYDLGLVQTFSDMQNPDEIDIKGALFAFKEIESVVATETAFLAIRDHIHSNDIVNLFYEALPEALKNKFKG